MADSLRPGQSVATISRWLSANVDVRLQSQGERFTDVTAAEARARQLATGSNKDAVVIRSADGTFEVFTTNELQRAADAPLDEIRADLRGVELPNGATIHTFIATRGHGANADVEPVVLGRRDPNEGFANDLVNAGLRRHEARAMREGITLRDLRGIAERLRPRAGEPAVAQVIQRIDSAIAANAGRGDAARIPFDGIASARPVASVASNAPPQVIAQATRLMESYRGRSQIVLDGVSAQGHQEFVDGWGFTGRVRPIDAEQAVLRSNAAIYSVRRDLQSGAIGPTAFGVTRWNDVTPQRMTELAERRLRDSSYDFAPVVPAMIEDPSYAQRPLRRTESGRSVPIMAEPGFAMSRSIASLVAPDRAALELQSFGIMRAVRDTAIADARGTTTPPAVGDLRVAVAQWRGEGLPRDASQAILAVSAATDVPIARVDVASGTTEAALKDRQRRGEIAAFAPSDQPGTFLTYTLHTPTEFARAVRQRMDDPARPPLSNEARTLVETIVGPPNQTGVELSRRLESEASWRNYRAIGNEVVIAAVAGAVSFGAGAVVSGSVSAGRATYFGVQASRAIGAARFAAQTTTFTTTAGAMRGELHATDYVRDAAMMGILGRAQQLGGALGVIARGTGPSALAAQRILGNVGAIGAASTAMTGWTVAENHLAGNPLQLREIRDSFVANLAMTTVLHGVNLGLARAFETLPPELRALRPVVEAQRRAQAARGRSERAGEELAQVIQRFGEVQPNTPAARLLTESLERKNRAFTEAQRAEREAYGVYAEFLRTHVPSMRLPQAHEVVASAIPELREALAVVRLTPDHLQGLQRLATEIGLGRANVRGIEPGLLVDPHLGPPLIDHLAPPSRTGAVPPQIQQTQLQQTLLRTERDGVTGLLSQPLAPQTALALRQDAADLNARVARMATTYRELATRAANGDRAAQARIDAFDRARQLLTARRSSNSTTINGTQGETHAPIASTNAVNVEGLTRGWLSDRSPLTPDIVRNRISMINDVATRGLPQWNGELGTRGAFRGEGLDVQTGAGVYMAGAEVEAAVGRFSQWFVRAEAEVAAGRMTSIELAARSYQTLVSIHPFVDGNGRSTRAFMDWVLQRHGLPPATMFGQEILVAHFPRNMAFVQDGGGSPDFAARSLVSGVTRSVSDLEAALYGTRPPAEQVINRLDIRLREDP